LTLGHIIVLVSGCGCLPLTVYKRQRTVTLATGKRVQRDQIINDQTRRILKIRLAAVKSLGARPRSIPAVGIRWEDLLNAQPLVVTKIETIRLRKSEAPD
jgi:hypothetical protein